MNYHPEKTLMGCLATFLFLIALMGAYLEVVPKPWKPEPKERRLSSTCW